MGEKKKKIKTGEKFLIVVCVSRDIIRAKREREREIKLGVNNTNPRINITYVKREKRRCDIKETKKLRQRRRKLGEKKRYAGEREEGR